ncbi:MAG: EAL domain-containing protein [Lachnospiraceae bacterium]|nr:EAL domain-containing protein [Lachnospiraceae bacterium]
MRYNLYFDYIGLAVLLVVWIYFQQKGKSALPSYRMYYVTLGVLLLTGSLDILTVLYQRYPALAGRSMIYAMNALNYASQIFVMVSFTMYLRCMTQVEKRLPFLWYHVIYTPFSIALVIMGIVAIHGYRMGEEGHVFRFHPALSILMAIAILYYLVVCTLIGIQDHVVQGKGKTMHLVIAAYLLGGVQLIQLFHPMGFIVVFFSALCMVDMLFAVQRAEEVFDSSDAMRRSVLMSALEQDYQNKKKSFVVFVRFVDYDVLESAIGQEDAEVFLRQVCAYLSDCRQDALVFRAEKNCLVVKLENRNKGEEQGIAEEIRNRFEEPWNTGFLQSMLSASFVTGFCPEEIVSLQDFHKVMNRLRKAEPEVGAILPAAKLLADNEEAHILEALQRALKEHSFQVYYQPIYSTKEKKVVAAEALIRLFDPVYGFIPPEDMITMAEREGCILEIGEFVFTEVCRFYAENQLDRMGIRYIEVNLSAVQCMQNRLAEEFMEIMRSFNLTSEKINFEITETSAMISNAVVSQNISHFELHGVSLSLDDYGTGYSNISYLYNLPFMFMKIDKSILWSAENNEQADIILRNTFRMAQRLHLKVVMEGVETEAQIRKLLALGCDYFQGYFFSKPVKGEDFIRYVRNFELPEVCK